MKELQANGAGSGDKDEVAEDAPTGDSQDKHPVEVSDDNTDVPMKFIEKKRLQWKGLTCMIMCCPSSPPRSNPCCQILHRSQLSATLCVNSCTKN